MFGGQVIGVLRRQDIGRRLARRAIRRGFRIGIVEQQVEGAVAFDDLQLQRVVLRLEFRAILVGYIEKLGIRSQRLP